MPVQLIFANCMSKLLLQNFSGVVIKLIACNLFINVTIAAGTCKFYSTSCKC